MVSIRDDTKGPRSLRGSDDYKDKVFGRLSFFKKTSCEEWMDE